MPIGVLHTTESNPGTMPGIINWFNAHPDWAPHTAFDPMTLEEHIWHLWTEASKALKNEPGGVETNNRAGGVVQIEIIGWAADVGQYPDWWYDNLRAYLQRVSALSGVEYVFHTDSRRFSFQEWTDSALSGWYGHVNVPENTHWDPGTLRYDLLLTPEEPEMELTDPIELRDHDVHGNFTGPFPTDVEQSIIFIHDASERAAARSAAARDNSLTAASFSQAASVKADQILDRLANLVPATSLDLQTVPTELILAELSRRLGLS